MRTFRIARRVLGTAFFAGASTGAHANPPLLEIVQPPEGSTAAVLFCPNCIPAPLLIEAHLYGRARLLDDQEVPEHAVQSVDFDLFGFTPTWRPGADYAPLTQCTYPLAVTSNEAKACLDRLGDSAAWQLHAALQSAGWPDTFGQSGLFEQESFLVGRGAAPLMEPGSEWCLQPVAERASVNAEATADLTFSVDGGTFRCRADVAVSTSVSLTHIGVAKHGCYAVGAPNVPPGIVVRVTTPGRVCVHIPGEWTCSASSYPPRCP